MKKDHPYHNESMWKGAPPENFGKAKSLRADMTEAEMKLWDHLKTEPFKRYRFRRQHPIQNFIVDFYSHKLTLVIEVDGQYHQTDDQKILDQTRTELLKFQELREIRFLNEEIFNDIESVLGRVQKEMTSIEH